MKSCIYEGRVSHTRVLPRLHRFKYRVFMMYLDLDELPTLFEKRWLWSSTRPALARFRREHHHGPADQDLKQSVIETVVDEIGYRPSGPVRLLTNLSYFGYCMNPVSFYYCFDADDEIVEAIVAEVTNTPWGEQQCYVLDCRAENKQGASWRFSPRKKMHVSPFIPMAIEYDWALSAPQDQLTVHMANSKDGKRFFSAGMALSRVEISTRSLASVLLRFPLQTTKIIAAIHWEALRLWLKRCPVYPHPKKNETTVTQA